MSSSRWEDSEQGDAGTGESASSRGGCISAVAPGGTDAGMAALRGVPRWLLLAAGARALQHERPAELPVSTRRHQATRADTEPLSTPCASRRGSARSAGHWLAEQHAQGREDNLCQPFFHSLHTCHQHHFTSTRPLCTHTLPLIALHLRDVGKVQVPPRTLHKHQQAALTCASHRASVRSLITSNQIRLTYETGQY